MATAAEIADKLDEARALIEKGWCQGEFVEFPGYLRQVIETGETSGYCFCAIGALSATVGQHYDDGLEHPAFSYLSKAVDQPNWEGVSNWNDAPERTQAEVIAAFRKAADLARAESAQ